MRVLVACEFSGIVREAFAARGHDALSCDLLDTEIPGAHYQGPVEDVLDDGWDLMIAHPPCTYLTNAGVRHLHEDVSGRAGGKAKISGTARWIELGVACEFFNLLLQSGIPRICVENPIPHRYARDLIGNYTQTIQPWMFGHEETKATCFWLKGLPPLKPTNIVGPPPKGLTIEMRRTWNRVHQTSPGPDRWKKRSRTMSGIAAAMAEQWG